MLGWANSSRYVGPWSVPSCGASHRADNLKPDWTSLDSCSLMDLYSVPQASASHGVVTRSMLPCQRAAGHHGRNQAPTAQALSGATFSDAVPIRALPLDLMGSENLLRCLTGPPAPVQTTHTTSLVCAPALARARRRPAPRLLLPAPPTRKKLCSTCLLGSYHCLARMLPQSVG